VVAVLLLAGLGAARLARRDPAPPVPGLPPVGRLDPELGAYSPEPGLLSATVELAPTGVGRVVGVRLEGDGLTPRAITLPPASLLSMPSSRRVRIQPQSDVDCRRVADGRYPARLSVVLDVVGPSGATRTQRLPLPATLPREPALQACGLPDPDLRARVEAEGASDGALVLFVEPVPRSHLPVTVQSVAIEGVTVSPGRGTALPVVVQAGSGYVFSLRPAVADCARARQATGVRVRLRVGEQVQTVTAAEMVSQPQAGGVPVARLLQRLVGAACPG
jgi:hypothetical protein